MTQGSNVTTEQVQQALGMVKEPATGRNLADLHMVTDVAVENGNVRINIDSLTPINTHKQKLERDIRAALDTIGGVGNVVIDMRTKVRPSGSGRSDAQPIPGVRNVVAVASSTLR